MRTREVASRGWAMVLVAVLAAPLGAQESGSFDFSGVERFWQVADLLSQGDEPSEEAWDALFATPGYRALTRSEFTRAFFREKFSLAFQPARQAERDRAREGDRYLRHFERVAASRARLDSIADALRESSVSTRALSLTNELLPPPGVADPPPVSFVIFANDARGAPDVVVDLLATETFDLVPFLAHEFHHYFRARMAVIDDEDVPQPQRDLWWVLRQIEAEGVADQVGNTGFFSGDLPVTADDDGSRRLVAATPDLLASFDEQLARLDRVPAEAARVGAEMREALPRSGHPTGYWMASLIRDRLGVETLVATVGDPFSFFRAYDRAAAASDGAAPRLSAAAKRALDALEGQLRMPRATRARP